MPLDTAIPEEISFRGALLAGLQCHVAVRRAIVASASVFTLWHVVIVTRTLVATNLADQPLLLGLGIAGALASIFVGGVIFAVLRVRTGNLAGSIVAHWAFNTTLLIGIYAPAVAPSA
jgi:membrane protease YdiL (CAAX protease family)